MDLRLYTRSGIYKSPVRDVEKMITSTLDEKTATYLETLSNKVVKFLLTSYGTDPINPKYGARTMNAIVSTTQVQWFSLNFQQDLQACFKFIKASETPGPNGELLAAINLIKITIDNKDYPSGFIVRIEIKTTDKQSALLHLKKNLG